MNTIQLMIKMALLFYCTTSLSADLCTAFPKVSTPLKFVLLKECPEALPAIEEWNTEMDNLNTWLKTNSTLTIDDAAAQAPAFSKGDGKLLMLYSAWIKELGTGKTRAEKDEAVAEQDLHPLRQFNRDVYEIACTFLQRVISKSQHIYR